MDPSEILEPTRSRSWLFYLVLLCVIGPLWAIVPLSWVYVVYVLRNGSFWSFGLFGKTTFVLALCEMFFSIHHYNLSKFVSESSLSIHGSLQDRHAALTRVLKSGMSDLPEEGFDEETLDFERPGSPAEAIIQLEPDDPRAIDFRNVLRTWFGRVKWSSINLHHIRQWLHWTIFNSELPPLDELSPTHRAAIDDVIVLLQKRAGKIIPEGGESTIKPMCLTIDPVSISMRPLIFYTLVNVTNYFLRINFEYTWGLKHGSYDGLEYLLRIPESWSTIGESPLIFIHGLGLGLFQYNNLLVHLVEQFPNRPILILLQPHISQNIFHTRFLRPMSRHETASRLAGLISSLGWAELDAGYEYNETDHSMVKKQGVTMLSHSNGSYTHAWMLKGYPHMVQRSCFVDPVTFCSWEGDVCYNFLYKRSTDAIHLIMRYFVGTELGVANLLQRHFDWASNALWYEEIPNARDPRKTKFLLGGKDAIVDASRVKKYLTSHGVRKGLWFDPDGRHGQALLPGGEGRREVIQWLKDDK